MARTRDSVRKSARLQRTERRKAARARAKANNPLEEQKHPNRPPLTTSNQVTIAALVIILSALIWLGGLWIGRQMGLPARYSVLLDLAALAGFAFAILILARDWYRRRN